MPEYYVEESGPDHQKFFRATVRVGGRDYGTGAGRSKKEAEQQAAEAAWKAISNGHEAAGAAGAAGGAGACGSAGGAGGAGACGDTAGETAAGGQTGGTGAVGRRPAPGAPAVPDAAAPPEAAAAAGDEPAGD